MNEYDYSQLKSCGEDVFISGNVEIRRPHLVSVGNHVAIDSGFYCTTNAEIGDYVHIAPYTTVIGGEQGRFRMEHFSGIAAGVRIVCVSEEYQGEGLNSPTVPAAYRDRLIVGPVVLERFAGVGSNAVILPGVTLREGSVVSACSLVTQDTEAWTVYAGIPARPVRRRPSEKMRAAAAALGYG
ncbi:MAG: acyltransferase [bacterium]